MFLFLVNKREKKDRTDAVLFSNCHMLPILQPNGDDNKRELLIGSFSYDNGDGNENVTNLHI